MQRKGFHQLLVRNLSPRRTFLAQSLADVNVAVDKGADADKESHKNSRVGTQRSNAKPLILVSEYCRNLCGEPKIS